MVKHLVTSVVTALIVGFLMVGAFKASGIEWMRRDIDALKIAVERNTEGIQDAENIIFPSLHDHFWQRSK